MSRLSRNYVLLCEEGKRYVGTTEHMLARVENHSVLNGVRGQGAAWLKRYPIVDILLVQPGGLKEEAELTLAQMKEYGWQNVRGAAWTSVDLLHPPLELVNNPTVSLELERHLSDTCFKCGSAGHYAHSCVVSGKAPVAAEERFLCYKCKQPGHGQQFCPGVAAVLPATVPSTSSGCRICHSPTHWARECPARRCFRCNGQGHSVAECSFAA